MSPSLSPLGTRRRSESPFFRSLFWAGYGERWPARASVDRLGPVLDAGNPQPSASCCTGLGFGEQGKALRSSRGLDHSSNLDQILRGRLPTVPRVSRCLEYVVGFSFGVRPTRTRSLQDGWFGACGPDGWLHESYTGCISVTAPKAAPVAKLSVCLSHSTRDLIHQSTSKLRQIQRSKPLRRGTDNPEIAAADRCCITLSARR